MIQWQLVTCEFNPSQDRVLFFLTTDINPCWLVLVGPRKQIQGWIKSAFWHNQAKKILAETKRLYFMVLSWKLAISKSKRWKDVHVIMYQHSTSAKQQFLIFSDKERMVCFANKSYLSTYNPFSQYFLTPESTTYTQKTSDLNNQILLTANLSFYWGPFKPNSLS